MSDKQREHGKKIKSRSTSGRMNGSDEMRWGDWLGRMSERCRRNVTHLLLRTELKLQHVSAFWQQFSVSSNTEKWSDWCIKYTVKAGLHALPSKLNLLISVACGGLKWGKIRSLSFYPVFLNPVSRLKAFGMPCMLCI